MTETPRPVQISAFRVLVYEGRRPLGEAVFDASGSGPAWREHTSIRVPGFDGSATLKLHELWKRVIEDRNERVADCVTGRETIVKFGSTQQLQNDYSVVIEATFA